MRPRRRIPRGTDPIAFLKSLPPARRGDAIALLSEPEREAIDRDWPGWAHEGQADPPALADGSDWSTWVLMAGRGFGKTHAGAQWIAGLVAKGAPLRIALVGATREDARTVMVEGRSGLLEVAGPWVEDWAPSYHRLRFRTGAEARLFSGASPEMLRGPEHHYAWCDELAKWEKPRESWDMLQLGLRLRDPATGPGPRALVTTTPRPGPVLRAIMAEPGTTVTRGPTRANPHLPAGWKRRVESLYAGTRLGRQELEGELLADSPGALWTVELIERSRTHSPSRLREGSGVGQPGAEATNPPPTPPASWRGEYARTLIAVDPPSGDGTCGIVACALDDRGVAHVLADHSVTARSPDGWAQAVAAAAAIHATREVVAEVNQGGAMVRTILRTAGPGLRVRPVRAHLGKSERAAPIAHRFEAGHVRLHGRMPELEAQLLGLIAGGGYQGPGPSPDRADAMVWGLTELFSARAEARVRGV